MKAIRNLNDLNRVLIPKMREAMDTMQGMVYSTIHAFMILYYKEYEPEEYQRTFQFFNSLVKSDIKRVNNGFECSVYIDFDSFKSGYEGNTPFEIVDMINRGFHADMSMNNNIYKVPYNIESRYHFWDDSIDEFKKGNYIINLFIDTLRSNGIKVHIT